MDRYSFTLTRTFEEEEYCQTVRINIAGEQLDAIVSAFADFLESAGFHSDSIQRSLVDGSRR